MATLNWPLPSSISRMDGFIDWCMERVDQVLERSKSQPEPPVEVRLRNFLIGHPRRDQYQERDPAKLQTQINGLADILRLAVRERDQARAIQETSRHRLNSVNLKLWILSGIVCAEGGLIFWLANQLFSRLH